MRLWGGRFQAATDPLVADFTRSVDLDRELAPDDLDGSIAHVAGLQRAGLLTEAEAATLTDGLAALLEEIAAGTFAWDPSLEDVHLNLEAALAARVGPVAAKLHTGRSRNDQVATDLRLWLRRALAGLDGRLLDLERALVERAAAEPTAVLPGTTHLQPAQPVLLAHHLLAYVEMLERDRGRFADAARRADESPLGSGALAGAGFPLDREATARAMGFRRVTRNSLDAVADRDFVAEALAAAALATVHLSRLAEELTWWANPAFGFVVLADAYSTGSSMMPHKRNPDPAELVRGKASRVAGDLATVLGLLKGLPLAYQRDLQETVGPLLDGVHQLDACLAVMAGFVASVRFDTARMAAAAAGGFSTATAVADVLVDQGLPFRVAHGVVGAVVARQEAAGATSLERTPDDVWRAALQAAPDPTAAALAADPALPERLRQGATVAASLARADVRGGTAPRRVSAELARARRRLGTARAEDC
ncbi:MAG TPA: argininosuccinate lyase [Candidatus Sulfotelmatobacter sp.]|nr:argininosuccinate lyase [Candidatus Sulfotelmatobacter sp.]